MPSNNDRYTSEDRRRIVIYKLESGRSATSVADFFGIDPNTVCRWVRAYRRSEHLPGYHEVRRLQRITTEKEKELTSRLKEKENRIRELEEEVRILKKCQRIFMQPQ